MCLQCLQQTRHSAAGALLRGAGAAQVFSKDETGMLRSWGPRANIPAVNQKAREAASQLLAQLAVLRTDSKQVKLAWRCCLLSLHHTECKMV